MLTSQPRHRNPDQPDVDYAPETFTSKFFWFCVLVSPTIGFILLNLLFFLALGGLAKSAVWFEELSNSWFVLLAIWCGAVASTFVATYWFRARVRSRKTRIAMQSVFNTSLVSALLFTTIFLTLVFVAAQTWKALNVGGLNGGAFPSATQPIELAFSFFLLWAYLFVLVFLFSTFSAFLTWWLAKKLKLVSVQQ